MNELFVNTPKYVLLDNSQRIGPKLMASHSGPECTVVYGFSDRKPYDVFHLNSHQALTPYPLVKRYLLDQLEAPGEAVHLVVVDATGPNDLQLNAVTMNSILDAILAKSEQVSVSFQLIRDEPSLAYRVVKTSLGPATELLAQVE